MGKVLFSLKAAKAWIAAAGSVVASVSAYVVPDTSVGRVLAAVAAALVTLGAVFSTANKELEDASVTE